jgi:hypothetical protein
VLEWVIVMPVRQSTEQDTFLAMVCADDELLRAEFEAIIDACWNPPPATRLTRPVRPPSRPSCHGAARQPAPSWRSDGRGGHEWIRQRSPPAVAVARHPCPTEMAERRVMS